MPGYCTYPFFLEYDAVLFRMLHMRVRPFAGQQAFYISRQPRHSRCISRRSGENLTNHCERRRASAPGRPALRASSAALSARLRWPTSGSIACGTALCSPARPCSRPPTPPELCCWVKRADVMRCCGDTAQQASTTPAMYGNMCVPVMSSRLHGDRERALGTASHQMHAGKQCVHLPEWGIHSSTLATLLVLCTKRRVCAQLGRMDVNRS